MNRELAEELVGRIARLERRLERLETMEISVHYRGSQAGDFGLAELPYPGDYGYQTTDAEIQVNCNGAVRAIATAAL